MLNTFLLIIVIHLLLIYWYPPSFCQNYKLYNLQILLIDHLYLQTGLCYCSHIIIYSGYHYIFIWTRLFLLLFSVHSSNILVQNLWDFCDCQMPISFLLVVLYRVPTWKSYTSFVIHFFFRVNTILTNFLITFSLFY